MFTDCRAKGHTHSSLSLTHASNGWTWQRSTKIFKGGIQIDVCNEESRSISCSHVFINVYKDYRSSRQCRSQRTHTHSHTRNIRSRTVVLLYGLPLYTLLTWCEWSNVPTMFTLWMRDVVGFSDAHTNITINKNHRWSSKLVSALQEMTPEKTHFRCENKTSRNGRRKHTCWGKCKPEPSYL